MSTIHTYPLFGHFLGTATDHVIELRAGWPGHAGVGQAFWFRKASTVLSEVPTTDQELSSLLHAATRDQQDITVQTNVTYRLDDPALVSQRLDFGVFPDAKDHQAQGRQQVATVVGQVVQAIVVNQMATLTLAQALEVGLDRLQGALSAALPDDARLQATGVAVLGARVLAIRPQPDIEKALQTPVREQLQAEADRATYERRALAVERESVIAANELASHIELATRRQDLLAQEGANNRREAEEAAAAALVKAQGDAERRGIAAQASASETELVGQAQAAKESAIMAVYANVGRDVLTALALREAAGALPAIEHLTITPDLLSGLLSSLTQRAEAGAS